MAAELVAGAFLSAAVQVLFDRMASRRVLNFFLERRNDEEKLRRLKTSLLAIKAVLDDVGEKQIVSHSVKQWLTELKDVVYDAEDLVDEIDYEAIRWEVEGKSQPGISQVRSYLSSLNIFKKNKKMDLKLEKTLNRVESMQGEISILGLSKGGGQNPQKPLRESGSLVEEAAIYGRDAEKEAVIKSLLSEDSYGVDIGVIPIVGMGGIGKTTLAQLVYNDSNVKEIFELRVWVSVSEESNVSRITQIMLQEVTSQKHGNQTLNQLQLKLKDQLTHRKFLIILDDVWDLDNDSWNHLLLPLRFGAKGSRILLTTRDETIASIVRTLPIYHLTRLLDDNCWLLFKHFAFGDVNFIPPLNEEIIGRKILDKCGGLPLAVKAIAGVLRSKNNISEWKQLLESEMWGEESTFLPALRLSYLHLPSWLKRCFAYCSIFPKDYKIEKEMLVRLWMAEGFLDHLDENSMEEVGREYVNNLIGRSFFQRIGDDTHIVMHNLMSNLAEAISGEYCCRIELDVLGEISSKTRHLTDVIANDAKKFEGVDKATRLRTFLTLNPYKDHVQVPLSQTLAQDMFPKLRFLRVFSLENYQNVQQLPCSVMYLKHVRYLDLSHSGMMMLPEAICSLYKLQTLKLFRCWKLNALPANLARLVDLSLLDIRGTQVKRMPLHMGRLRKLKTLTTFRLGKQHCSTIIELKNLQLLQGTLSILGLQNVVSASDALEANLSGKENLKELSLNWTSRYDRRDSQHEGKVLTNLQPHTNLERLVIKNYGGTHFPSWVGECSFSCLKSLKLMGAKNCISLPCLGQLPSLLELQILGFDSLVIVGAEFWGIASSMGMPFRSLEVLSFENMSAWRYWYSLESGFPRLKKLKLKSCPKLRETLPKNLPSLTEIEIRWCGQLVAQLPMAPALRKMELEYSEQLLLTEIPWGLDTVKLSSGNTSCELQDELLPCEAPPLQLNVFHSFHFTSSLACGLKRLIILRCKSLRSIRLELLPRLNKIVVSECDNLETLSASQGSLLDLHSMEIRGCQMLVSFPEGGISAPNLKELRLSGCTNLKSLPKHMSSCFPSFKSFLIQYCDKVESFPEDGLPLSLELLIINGCRKLVHGWRQWDLKNLSSLQSIVIYGGFEYDAESFPEEDFLPSSIVHLSITGFQSLKSVNEQGLQQLTSLKNLKFFGCPNLHSLPVHLLPVSLNILEIYHCPLLAKRCEKAKGDYWPFVSHMPFVRINHNVIRLC